MENKVHAYCCWREVGCWSFLILQKALKTIFRMILTKPLEQETLSTVTLKLLGRKPTNPFKNTCNKKHFKLRQQVSSNIRCLIK